VKGSDVSMLAIPCAVILTVAVVATLPAILRALRIDPVEILRAE
jgi:putative ABC transport system permease protein